MGGLLSDNSIWMLKQALARAPILGMPDFHNDFVVEMDAFGFGLGENLLQKGNRIAYYSKIMGPRARLKSMYEKELRAILVVVLKWKHYLFKKRCTYGWIKFKIISNGTRRRPEITKLVSKSIGFNFEIHYKPTSCAAHSFHYVGLGDNGFCGGTSEVSRQEFDFGCSRSSHKVGSLLVLQAPVYSTRGGLGFHARSGPSPWVPYNHNNRRWQNIPKLILEGTFQAARHGFAP